MSNNQSPHFPLKLNLNSHNHLALRLGYPIDTIEYFKKNKNSNVKELILNQIKNGKLKERVVYNPSPQYKKLLRAINSKLLRRYVLPEGVLGGVIGKCIDDLVKVHCNQEAVLSMDLKNFFPSIKSGRVVKFFRSAGCSPDISGILTDLVTLKDSLPQGFPTSPMLANLIAYGLDIQHIMQGRKYNLRRTRWIDDIVFSGRSKDLAINAKLLLGAIKPHGFQLNNKKTEYKVRSNNPIVVGLDVSCKIPHVPIVAIAKVREILYDCKYSGVKSVQVAYESDSFGRKKDLKSSLKGRIQYIARYNKAEGEELVEIFNSIDY
jgi:hypothetical protein